MMSVQAAISRFRRDLTIGRLLRNLMLAAAVACALTVSYGGIFPLLAVCGLWTLLNYRSFQGSRLTADSPLLIASGRFEEAETRIDAALRSFSISSPAKLLSLHHLAVLRNAQRRYQESAQLCKALQHQRLGVLRGLNKPSLLLLADDLLHIGDLAGVHEAISRLFRHHLNLAEALSLQQIQTDYLAAIGAYDQILAQVWTKIQLAELMPPGPSARTQALLALAAQKMGRSDLSSWLRRRAELLWEPAALLAERPILAELWPQPPVPVQQNNDKRIN